MGVVCDVSPQGMRVEVTTAGEGGSDDEEDAEAEAGAGQSLIASDPSHLRRGLGHLRWV